MNFLPSIFSAPLEWHRGPANGGDGTAGQDTHQSLWFDGDLLLIIVENNEDQELHLVSVVADNNHRAHFLDSQGKPFDAGGPEAVSWWAQLWSEHFPPV